MAVTTVSGVARAPRISGWIHSRSLDIALATCWLPFAIAAMVVSSDAGHVEWLTAAVLSLSLAHQPITVAMVYGDKDQFNLRRRLFTWTPLVLGAAIYIGLHLSLVLVAVIGAAWNTEHTLMQRYGIVRIYRRKGGDTAPGRLDLELFTSWLMLTLAWVVADSRTAERIEDLGLGSTNKRGAELLVDVRPAATVLLVAAAMFAAVTSWRWMAREVRAGFVANPAVYGYVAATGALFVVAMVHPVAGFVAWIGSHAVEYFIIVTTNLDSRYASGQSRSVIGRAVLSPLRALGVVIVVSGGVYAGIRALDGYSSSVVYGVAFFLVGGLHVFYDGFIWKLRRPQVADTFAIER